MNNEKIGEFLVLSKIMFGNDGVVIGENPQALEKNRFAVLTFSEVSNYIGKQSIITNTSLTSNYPEAVKLFSEKAYKQADKFQQETKSTVFGDVITKEGCQAISYSDCINNKFVVINPTSLKESYQVASHQIYYCIGGFGAEGNARGRACYCTCLLDGETNRWERDDILGTIDFDALPEWAKQAAIKNVDAIKKKYGEKEENAIEAYCSNISQKASIEFEQEK